MSTDSSLDFDLLPFKAEEVSFWTSLSWAQTNPQVQVETGVKLPISPSFLIKTMSEMVSLGKAFSWD